MKTIVTICARGGSKGVLGKNVRLMNGEPLIVHTLRQAKALSFFNAFAVSSDSEEILNIAHQEGYQTIKRPDEMASDTAGKIPVIRHCVQEMEKRLSTTFDLCIDLDCTSPLRNLSDIQNVYELINQSNIGNVITAMHARRSPYFNMVKVDADEKVTLVNAANPPLVRRQDAPVCYDMNASIYAWKREVLEKNDRLFLDTTKLYVMPEDRSIDIDSELDFQVVEMILKRRNFGA